MVSLESLKMGTKAQISKIDGNAHFQSRIVSVGLIPGSHVEIILNQKNVLCYYIAEIPYLLLTERIADKFRRR